MAHQFVIFRVLTRIVENLQNLVLGIVRRSENLFEKSTEESILEKYYAITVQFKVRHDELIARSLLMYVVQTKVEKNGH